MGGGGGGGQGGGCSPSLNVEKKRGGVRGCGGLREERKASGSTRAAVLLIEVRAHWGGKPAN